MHSLLGQSFLGETESVRKKKIGLVGRTIQTSSAGRVDDTTELLFAEMRPCSSGACVGTLEVDFCNLIPLLVGHVLKTRPGVL